MSKDLKLMLLTVGAVLIVAIVIGVILKIQGQKNSSFDEFNRIKEENEQRF